jgi:hypothetical protein
MEGLVQDACWLIISCINCLGRYQSPLPADEVKPLVEYDNDEGIVQDSLMLVILNVLIILYGLIIHIIDCRCTLTQWPRKGSWWSRPWAGQGKGKRWTW